MAQFARPDGNITQTSFTGGFAEIDEVSPSDSDFAYGANNTAAELEVSLLNVVDPQASTGHTFRYRIAKVNNGVLSDTGNAVTITARLMQGTTQIATDTARTCTGTWTTYTFTLSAAEADAITNYDDLRLEFVTSASGGSPANRRGGAVSWAELEVPSAIYTDAATVYLDLQPSGTDVAATQDSTTVYLNLSALGTEYRLPAGTFEAYDAASIEAFGETWPPTDGYTPYGSFYISRSNDSGTYTIATGLLSWDTSAIPDNAVITSAKVILTPTFIGSPHDADLDICADWYDWGSTADSSDWSGGPVDNAHALGITTLGDLSVGVPYEFVLSGYTTNVNKTGITHLRFHFDVTGAPSDPTLNEVLVTGIADDALLALTWTAGEYLDSITIPLTLTPSGSEKQEAVDSATTPLVLTPSSLEAHESTDDATVYLTLTASGIEFQGAEYSDSETVYLDLQVTEIPFGVLIDDFTGSDGSIDGRTALNGDTWHVEQGGSVAISGNQIGSAFGGAMLNGPYGPDVRVWITVVTPPTGDWDNYLQLSARFNGTALYALLLYPGTDTNLRTVLTNPFTWIDWQSVTVTAGDKIALEVIGNHVRAYHYTGGAWTLVSDEIDNTLSAAGAIGFVRDPIGGGDIVVDDFGGGTVIPEFAELVDSATVYLDLQPSSAEIIEALDAAEVYLNIEASGTELVERTYQDAATANLVHTPSSVEVHEVTDEATVYLTLTPSSEEAVEFTDAGTIYLVSTPSSAEYVEHADSATIPLALLPSSVEAAEWIDAQTIYLTIIPSGVDEYQPSFTQTPTDRVALTADTPATRTDHYIYVVCSITNNAHDGVMRFQLYEGSTAIGPEFETDPLTTTPTEFAFHLPDADAEDIVDYTNLELEFYGYSGSGDPTEFHFHEAWLVLPAPSEAETTDSATIYLKLTASGVDVFEAVDSSTVPLDLVASGVEAREITDAETIYVDLQTSGVEAREATDAETIYVDIEPATADIAEFADAQTTYLDLEASGVDVYVPSEGIEYTDAATVYLDIAPDSLEERVATDADTVLLAMAISSADIAVFVDTEQVGLLLTPTGVEAIEHVDAETIYLDIETTSAEVLEAVDSAETYVDIQASGVEYAERTDQQTVYVDLTASGVDVAEYVDSATTYLLFTITGDEYIAGQYVDIGSVYLDLLTSSVELAEYVEAQTIYLDLQPNSAELRESSDEETVPFALSPSGTDISIFVDQAATYLDLQASGIEEHAAGGVYTDADTVLIDIQASGADILEASDAYSAYLDLTPSSIDIAEFYDAETVNLYMFPTAVELREQYDADTIYVDIQPDSVEVAIFTDTAVVGLLITPTSADIAEFVDAQTIYLVLTPGRIYEYEDADTVYLKLTPSEAAIILTILLGYILGRRYSGTVGGHYAGSILGRRLSTFFDRRWKGEHHRRWLR